MDDRTLGKNGIRLHSQTRRNYFRVSRMRERLRVASNAGLIVGQCLLLFVSRDFGLVVIICSSFLSVPFFFHAKMWDVLVLMAFLSVVNVVGLFVQ